MKNRVKIAELLVEAALATGELKQGNFSLRRPPKLIIPQAVIRH